MDATAVGSQTHARVPLAPSARPRYRVTLYRASLTGLAAAGVMLLYGFDRPPVPTPILDALVGAFGSNAFAHTVHAVQALLLTAYVGDVVYRVRRGIEPTVHDRVTTVDWALLAVALLGGLVGLGVGGRWWLPFELATLLVCLVELWRLNVSLSRFFARPGITLPLSFLFLIAIGTVVLKLPVCVPPGHTLSWLDALFTITSAVCVTGLVVHNTATHFTPIGQTVIATFIQLGGLGIIIFGSMIALLLGRTFSIRENLNLSQILQDLPVFQVRNAIRFFVFATLAIELLGAALLFPMWDDPASGPLTFAERAGMSLFHSISAFCNAGFDITGESMIPYRYSLLAHAVIAPLVIVGGLGFPVLSNLLDVATHRVRRRLRHRRPDQIGPADLSRQRLSLHTKVVLAMSALLYLYGVVAIAAGQLMPYVYEATHQGITAHVERPAPFGPAAAGRILADASFMSISARSGGFNPLPMDEIGGAGRFTLMTLMFVGGSPGSTAGGVKTTAVGILLLSVLSTLWQHRETEAFGRSISDAIVRRAGTLLVCYVALVVVGTLLLTLSEPFPFERVFFEAVSAATTTGLSLGITPDLSSFGKAVVVALMFLGRVGPLALLSVVVLGGGPQRPYRYPHEDVGLG